MLSTYKKLKNQAVMHFENAVADSPISLDFNFFAEQSGSGDPSPTNIRTITGCTDRDIKVSPTDDVSDSTNYNISFSAYIGTTNTAQEALNSGIIYGGNLSINHNGTATLTITHTAYDLGKYSYGYVNGELWRTSKISDSEFELSTEKDLPSIICENYKTVDYETAKTTDKTITSSTDSYGNTYVYIKDSDYRSGAAIKAALNGVKLVFKRKEPIVYTFSQTITEFGDSNYVWIATGENINLLLYEEDFSGINNELNKQHFRITFPLEKVSFEDEEFSISGFDMSTYMNPDINLTFGVAYMSEMRMDLFRSEKTDQLIWTREFVAELGVENNSGDTLWLPIGIFAGDRPISTTKETIEFTAYDRMRRFDKKADDFLTLMSFPCTLQELYDRLCAFVGVANESWDEIPAIMSRTITSSIIEMKNFSSCREILASIAEANGCYAKVTNEGILRLVWFEDHTSDYLLERNNIFRIDSTDLMQVTGKRWEEAEMLAWQEFGTIQWGELYDKNLPLVIQAITATWKDLSLSITEPEDIDRGARRSWSEVEPRTWDELNEYTWDYVEDLGWNGNIMLIEDNPFIYYDTEQEIRDHLERIVNRVKNFEMYYVANIDAIGNWLIEPGDIISLELKDGSHVNYPIFSRVLSWNGICECNYESTGSLMR